MTRNKVTIAALILILILTISAKTARRMTAFDADTYWQYQTVIKLEDIPEDSVPFPLIGGDPETLVVMNVHGRKLENGWAVRMSHSRAEPDGWVGE